jgi:pimeloyl-ACP methyl ester carboxylesterase
VPILIVRGANSDLLPADLAREMVRRNPPANVREIEGCSTRNPLMSPDQIRYVSDFLTCDAPLA